jgi:hypothetical protein
MVLLIYGLIVDCHLPDAVLESVYITETRNGEERSPAD